MFSSVCVLQRLLYRSPVSCSLLQSWLVKMAPLLAKVKSILSGDTIILTNAKGQERTLSLAFISAPRLKREGDEVRTGAFPSNSSVLTSALAICIPITRIPSRTCPGQIGQLRNPLCYSHHETRIRQSRRSRWSDSTRRNRIRRLGQSP